MGRERNVTLLKVIVNNVAPLGIVEEDLRGADVDLDRWHQGLPTNVVTL
jgi:hypothetical protein